MTGPATLQGVDDDQDSLLPLPDFASKQGTEPASFPRNSPANIDDGSYFYAVAINPEIAFAGALSGNTVAASAASETRR